VIQISDLCMDTGYYFVGYDGYGFWYCPPPSPDNPTPQPHQIPWPIVDDDPPPTPNQVEISDE